MVVIAASTVIDAIAVADIEALLRAILPDRALDEPRERLWKASIKEAGVDLICDQAQQVRTPAWPIASYAIRMIGFEAAQNPCSVHEVVHQGVDYDKAAANFEPQGAFSTMA